MYSETKNLTRQVLLAMLILIGFTDLRRRGHNNSTARVITIAPHSTFFDVLPVLLLRGVPSIVAKAEVKRIPIFGSMSSLFSTFLKALSCFLFL